MAETYIGGQELLAISWKTLAAIFLLAGEPLLRFFAEISMVAQTA